MTVEKILNRVRPSLMEMKAYQSARSMFQDNHQMVYLDANEINEQPYIGAPAFNRYAAQQPKEMVDAMCRYYDVSSKNLIIARGADEAIDICIRTFCNPHEDNIIICPPTFPMYAQSAMVNQTTVKETPLTDDFQLDLKAIESQVDKQTKIIFICTPNNPTANSVDTDDILKLCDTYPDTLIAADETYLEFTGAAGLDQYLDKYANLILFRTLSKSFASAGLRCGVAIGHGEIIGLMKKVLAPYPVPVPVANELVNILEPKNQVRMKKIRDEVLETRDWFMEEVKSVDGVQHVYPSDANFVLVKVYDAGKLYQHCLENNFIIRDQSMQLGLENCLRISIGSRDQMEALLNVMRGETIDVKTERTATVNRNTNETKISVVVNLDNLAPIKINTGVGFFDHMIEQIAKHGGFALTMECDGDLHIDPHHTIEDCAIALGQALTEALGNKRGIGRYGFALPMDEANASALIDLSGRYFLKFEGEFPAEMVGDLPCDMIEHIFRSLTENMQMNLHIKVEGENAHHMVEGCFKAFGRALRQAVSFDGDANALPSTKGML